MGDILSLNVDVLLQIDMRVAVITDGAVLHYFINKTPQEAWVTTGYSFPNDGKTCGLSGVGL